MRTGGAAGAAAPTGRNGWGHGWVWVVRGSGCRGVAREVGDGWPGSIPLHGRFHDTDQARSPSVNTAGGRGWHDVTMGARARTRSAAALVRQPDVAGAPAPEQLHVQFGADAATQIAVSWAAPASVARPRLRAGRAGTGLGLEVPAEERVYTEALTGETVYTYHARLGNLAPDTAFVYEALHDGAEPVPGTFRTGPRGRSAGFRFTSFGDQSIPAPVGLGFGPASVNAGYIVDAVDALDPLFHLINGDLSYANVSDAPVATWASFFGSVASGRVCCGCRPLRLETRNMPGRQPMRQAN